MAILEAVYYGAFELYCIILRFIYTIYISRGRIHTVLETPLSVTRDQMNHK